MPRYCNKIIQQGKRKGEKCGNPCRKGGDKCMHHDKYSKAYKNKYYLSTKYCNLQRRISTLISENTTMIGDINREREHLTKLLNGIEMYLDKDVKYDDDEYIEYTNTNKHNALFRKETLLRRKRNLKKEKCNLIETINTLKEAKVVLKKNRC